MFAVSQQFREDNAVTRLVIVKQSNSCTAECNNGGLHLALTMLSRLFRITFEDFVGFEHPDSLEAHGTSKKGQYLVANSTWKGGGVGRRRGRGVGEGVNLHPSRTSSKKARLGQAAFTGHRSCLGINAACLQLMGSAHSVHRALARLADMMSVAQGTW